MRLPRCGFTCIINNIFGNVVFINASLCRYVTNCLKQFIEQCLQSYFMLRNNVKTECAIRNLNNNNRNLATGHRYINVLESFENESSFL